MRILLRVQHLSSLIERPRAVEDPRHDVDEFVDRSQEERSQKEQERLMEDKSNLRSLLDKGGVPSVEDEKRMRELAVEILAQSGDHRTLRTLVGLRY